MNEEIYKILSQEHQPDGVVALAGRLKELVSLSRGEMDKYYAQWDANDDVYRGRIKQNEADRAAVKRDEPKRMVLPMTFAQVQAFTAFCQTVFTQRDYVFELSGSGAEDERAAKLATAALEFNLTYNKFKGSLQQHFLKNIAVYGLGVFKHSWVTEKTYFKTQAPDPNFQQNPAGPQVQPPLVDTYQEKVRYQGNKIVVVSPYRFFPDPRVPLSRFQEGEFCASEDEYSMGALYGMERDRLVAGVRHVQKLKPDIGNNDVNPRRRAGYVEADLKTEGDPRYALITEVQVLLNPSKTFLGDKDTQPLNKDVDREIRYLVWIANDDRIIRLDEMNYAHDEFTYDVAPFLADDEHYLNLSLVELVGALQDTINWLINSRITSVRKTIDNKFVVDPKGVEMEDLKSRSPVIRLKQIASGSGVERWIKQLNVQDVTTNHLNDANFLEDYAKSTTGITDNLLGNFASGRRSAMEARTVNSSASSRLVFIAQSIWENGYAPLGRKMLSNIRQGMDIQQLVRITGLPNLQLAGPDAVSNFMTLDKSQLVGNYDFLVFDGTAPSVRGAIAEALQELLVALLNNPSAVPVLGYDPTALLDETLELRGVRNASRFKLTPDRLNQLIGMAQLARNVAGSGGPGQPGGRPQPGSGVPNA